MFCVVFDYQCFHLKEKLIRLFITVEFANGWVLTICIVDFSKKVGGRDLTRWTVIVVAMYLVLNLTNLSFFAALEDLKLVFHFCNS